ncbi:hypothetical protein K439DRAFT_1659112 [Ramaria rubella]|nr:hypothetical protein K439DRAFT_1659112 [Ramaria rubella]
MLSNAGINKWATAVRHRMANDPGRQDLDDHILCNGFLFLDEYLEDILLGARSEPIIELTKTPGRRKDASKKDRIATAANVKSVLSQSPNKENVPVITSPPFVKKAPTSFQKALLKASRENHPPDITISSSRFPDPLGIELENPFSLDASRSVVIDLNEKQEEKAVEILITPPLARTSSVSFDVPVPQFHSPTTYVAAGATTDLVTAPPITTVGADVELSVIAEGDETEISRLSLPSRPIGPIIRDKEISYHIPTDPNNPNGPMSTVTISYDPNGDDDDDTQAFPGAFDRTFNDSEPTSTASSFPIDPYARDYETHELPRIPSETAQLTEQRPPHSPPSTSLPRKASIPVFPSLPAPSPPRKPAHVAGPVQGITRPSTAAGGTRSSWLNKARDVTAKRTSAIAGVKRKSGELAGEIDHILPMEDSTRGSRAAKVAKTNPESELEDASDDKGKPQVKVAIQPFRAVVSSKARDLQGNPESIVTRIATPDDNSEGMMNMLKRTVEGLGARVGKSMGKSVGGAAATAAAIEAKAAAEARLAQREAKDSKGTETKQGRLSVSDLIDTYEGGGQGKAQGREWSDANIKLESRPSPPAPTAPHLLPESRASISTTPPNSPPVSQHSVTHLHPPPDQTTRNIPKFQLQRNIQQESSFIRVESQPSTQSTYVSSIFDDHNGWPQSSYTTEFTTSQSSSQPRAQYQYQDLDFYDQEASELSREVGWAQSHTKPTLAQSTAISSKAFHGSYLLPAHPQAPGDAVHRPPSSFHQDHQAGGEINDLLDQGSDDMHEEPSTSSDVAEAKSKASSCQDMVSLPTGFVAQASTLLSKVMGTSTTSTLGGSKRGKPEPLKSIQLAAAAAKKQQEEADRKAARLKEMDKRRAAIASKKADQEREKSKQHGDRLKRERDESEKNVTKVAVKKVEEESTKKRKVVVEIEKKPTKKPLSKDKKDLGSSRFGKPALNASLSHSQLSSSLSKAFKQPILPVSAPQPSVKLIGSSQSEPKLNGALPKAGSTHIKDIEDVRQPSQALHAQMQARVQAQILQARQEGPLVPSESIELPDINSEYSNSDDEDRPRTFDPPDWAQSPVLGIALQSQSRLNPDDIFGPVRPLRMEEIFTTRHSRFRARTSSANWAGTDELTAAEQHNYARRMGYLD